VEPPRLAEHDPRWAERFDAEAEAIRLALGDVAVAVEHVGSTAVAGLAAKPTIDIVVGVTTLELPEEAVDRMAALGYEDARADSRPGERRFRKGETVPREVIVHVVEHRGEEWRSDLAFRDALRADPELAQAYEELKRRLLAERGTWYSGRDKESFVRRALARWAAETTSAAETEAVGASVAGRLRPGDLVLVTGELGAGKTTFVRGACRALGVTERVTSPTFTVGHRYVGADGPVSHLDLYRFAGVTAAEWGDLEPYFEDAICFVEWPEAAGTGLPPVRASVSLAHVDPSRRRVALDAPADLLQGFEQ